MKVFDLFNKSFVRFLMVGVANTLLSAILMFVLEDCGYWISTSIAYIVGAILSFGLNKRFTFKSKGKMLPSLVKFFLNVVICYIIAYSLAQPIAGKVLKNMPLSAMWCERLTKLLGMAFYTLINYFGQRFFAFKDNEWE